MLRLFLVDRSFPIIAVSRCRAGANPDLEGVSYDEDARQMKSGTDWQSPSTPEQQESLQRVRCALSTFSLLGIYAQLLR